MSSRERSQEGVLVKVLSVIGEVFIFLISPFSTAYVWLRRDRDLPIFTALFGIVLAPGLALSVMLGRVDDRNNDALPLEILVSFVYWIFLGFIWTKLHS